MNSLNIFTVVQSRADAPAVIDDTRTWTFREVSHRCESMAKSLRRFAAHGRPLAFVAESDIETLTLIYTALALEIPILPLHPREPDSAHRELVERAGAIWLGGSESGSEGDNASYSRDPGAGPRDRLGPILARDRNPTVALMASSGSTGFRQLARLHRDAFVFSAAAVTQRLTLTKDERWLLDLPLSHIGGLSILTRMLWVGGAVVLGRSSQFDPERSLDRIERHRVTRLSWVPTMLQKFLGVLEGAVFPSSPRSVLLGGAAISPATLQEALEVACPALCTYGLTECCSQVTCQIPGQARSNEGALGADVGPPLEGVEVELRDGEVCVKGPLLAELDGSDGERVAYRSEEWLHTGDLGRWGKDATLMIVGRKGDRIISGGENVDPREVEAVLSESPQVKDAAVFGRPDPYWGELVAAVVVPREPSLGLSEFTDYCRKRLAAFQRPRLLALSPEIPTNPVGKVSRPALLREYQSQLQPLLYGNDHDRAQLELK